MWVLDIAHRLSVCQCGQVERIVQFIFTLDSSVGHVLTSQESIIQTALYGCSALWGAVPRGVLWFCWAAWSSAGLDYSVGHS